MKLSPFYSSLAHFARRLDDARAPTGLVLFNRFYQPDIDVENLEVVPRAAPLELRPSCLLRLRWLAILSGQVAASLAVTGGVHTAVDVVKAVMAGAHAVQMVSRSCCATARGARRASATSWRAGWRSTSTSRCARCRAA